MGHLLGQSASALPAYLNTEETVLARRPTRAGVRVIRMTQRFGSDNARLTIRTGRSGAASKAGHDLLIEVGSWQATLEPEAQPALRLTADSRSLRVLEGT